MSADRRDVVVSVQVLPEDTERVRVAAASIQFSVPREAEPFRGLTTGDEPAPTARADGTTELAWPVHHVPLTAKEFLELRSRNDPSASSYRQKVVRDEGGSS